jgi:hypothetical protein
MRKISLELRVYHGMSDITKGKIPHLQAPPSFSWDSLDPAAHTWPLVFRSQRTCGHPTPCIPPDISPHLGLSKESHATLRA